MAESPDLILGISEGLPEKLRHEGKPDHAQQKMGTAKQPLAWTGEDEEITKQYLQTLSLHSTRWR